MPPNDEGRPGQGGPVTIPDERNTPESTSLVQAFDRGGRAAIRARIRIAAEMADLADLEEVIEQGLASFVEVGNALLAIKAGKKYQASGYSTFEDYCERRWNIGRNYGHRLTVAAATVEALANALPEMLPRGNTLPTTEKQVRPLAIIARENPAEAAEVWTEAVERSNGDQPTAAVVAEVVAERRPKLTVVPVKPGKAKPKPADRHEIHYRGRRIDPCRIIDESIAMLDGIASGLALIEVVSSLDAEKRLVWLDAIHEPLRAINRFTKELRG